MQAPLKRDIHSPEAPGRLSNVFLTFLKLGLTSFGGPIAHVGFFRRELVERQGWVSESQFSQLFAVCQFLPGPASSQLGFSLGLIRAGWKGALTAFAAFTLPSVFLLMGFVAVLPLLSGTFGESFIHGLKLVACAVVADAVLRMFKTLCPDAQRRGIAVGAALVLLYVSTVWVQLGVIIAGAVLGIVFLGKYTSLEDAPIQVGYGKRTGLYLAVIFVTILILLSLNASAESNLLSIAEAFYRAGALVFGGGHVVLPLLQEAVVKTGWVSEGSFLAGYGVAQAIPGPMFAFSAYVGAMIQTETSMWVVASTALVFMFLPGFLLVSATLPAWATISHSKVAPKAIAGINAVVVGILAVALYDPIIISGVGTVADAIIALVGFGVLAYWRVSPIFVVCWCVSASMLLAT